MDHIRMVITLTNSPSAEENTGRSIPDGDRFAHALPPGLDHKTTTAFTKYYMHKFKELELESKTISNYSANEFLEFLHQRP